MTPNELLDKLNTARPPRRKPMYAVVVRSSLVRYIDERALILVCERRRFDPTGTPADGPMPEMVLLELGLNYRFLSQPWGGYLSGSFQLVKTVGPSL
jgi:hypothetical protein